MPRITPIPAWRLKRVFEKAGFQCVRTEGDHYVYNGPRNLDRVICYTWERKRGGPSGEFEEAASAVV